MKHITSRLVTSVVTLLSFIVVLTTALVSCEESTPVELTPSVTPGSGGGGGNSGGGQEEEKPYLTVSPQSLSFDAEDNSLETIKVSSNTTYRVSTNASWIKLTPSGNDNYVVSVSSNEEEAMREDSVIVSSATLRQSVRVQQLGKAVEYTLSIDKTMISAGSSAHSDSVHIIGNDIWTATPSDEWITLSATSGAGEQQLYVSLTANEQPSVRTGNVMIIGEKSGAELLVNVSQSGTDYNFAVSHSSITATSAATTQVLDLTTNDAWSVQCEATWVSLSATEGTGDSHIEVSLSENKTTEERKATLTLTGKNSGSSASVSITQAGKYLAVTPESLSFGSAYDSKSLSVDTDGTYQVESSEDWISTSVQGKDVVVSVTPNVEMTSRTGTLTISLTGLTAGSLSRKVNVSQSGTVYDFSVNVSSLEAGSTADTQTFQITTNDAWKITTSESWISVSASQGSGSRLITVNLSENTTTEERTGRIDIKGTNSGSTARISVSQSGKYLTLDSETLSFAPAGGTKSLTVSTDGTFQASTSMSWLTVSTSGSRVNVEAEANAGTSSRSGTVTVSLTGLTSGSISRVISITQTGEDYDLSVDKTSLSFDSRSGSKAFTITSNDSWTASSNVSWATLSSTSGSGNKTITVSCAANTNTTERSGTITIQGNYSGSRTISVSQEGKPSSGGGNGYDNGHEYVDLGLPSGLLWATCNVGANNPEDYGDYFAWGETEPKSEYNWSTYKWCNGSYHSITKYWIQSDYGTVDNKTVLEYEDDAAHVNWGGSWSMPTREEQDELRSECTWEWTTQNGVNGCKVTGPNGNSIFLPAAGSRYSSSLYYPGSYGNYWSSSLNASDSSDAYYLYFSSDGVDWYYRYGRCSGRSVRPVR